MSDLSRDLASVCLRPTVIVHRQPASQSIIFIRSKVPLVTPLNDARCILLVFSALQLAACSLWLAGLQLACSRSQLQIASQHPRLILLD